MQDRHQVTWAVVAGAAIGGLIGYLFFTRSGRRLRARVEPAVDDLLERAQGWRGAVARLSAFAAENGLLAGETRAEDAGWDDDRLRPH